MIGEFFMQYKNEKGRFGGKQKLFKLSVTRRLGGLAIKELEWRIVKSKETANAKYTWKPTKK